MSKIKMSLLKPGRDIYGVCFSRTWMITKGYYEKPKINSTHAIRERYCASLRRTLNAHRHSWIYGKKLDEYEYLQYLNSLKIEKIEKKICEYDQTNNFVHQW